jgi:hypothetical protein
MEALERGPTQRRDVGTGHPVINLTTAVENYEREKKQYSVPHPRNRKNISSGQKETRHVIWSSHVLVVPLFALDVRPQDAAAAQHKWKKSQQTWTLPADFDRGPWGSGALIGQCPRQSVDPTSKVQNPTVQVHEGEQPRLLPLSIGSGFHSSPRHVAAGSWLHSRLAKKMVQTRDGGDPVPRLHLHVN